MDEIVVTPGGPGVYRARVRVTGPRSGLQVTWSMSVDTDSRAVAVASLRDLGLALQRGFILDGSEVAQ